MDIAGAKALKQRLGANAIGDASPPADVPADAPPLYHWVGVSKERAESPRADGEDEAPSQSASLFSRLGLSFR